MIRALMALILVPFLLTACGQEAQKQADDGNAKIARMNEIRKTVYSKHGVLLVRSEGGTAEKINTLNATLILQLGRSEALELKNSVTEMTALGDHVLRILDRDDVSFTGDRNSIRSEVESARRVLGFINARLAQKTTDAPAPTRRAR